MRKLPSRDWSQEQDYGEDLRSLPLERREAKLARLLAARETAYPSMSTSGMTARRCSRQPARWAFRASCQNGWARRIDPGAPGIGSRPKTQSVRRCSACRRRIGDGRNDEGAPEGS